jgi:hypothetical protein
MAETLTVIAVRTSDILTHTNFNSDSVSKRRTGDDRIDTKASVLEVIKSIFITPKQVHHFSGRGRGMKHSSTVTLTTHSRRKGVTPLFIHFGITALYSYVSTVQKSHKVNTYL